MTNPSPPAAEPPQILDLRHFTAAQLRPLLEDEAQRWNQRLHWDYSRAIELLLEYIDGRILPGFVALQQGRVVGYAFGVMEANKAVIGDIYAFNEAEAGQPNPLCETLLRHLIETLQATPGIERIESQLLMFGSGQLAEPFAAAGFRAVPRLFMGTDLPLTRNAALARETRAETRLPPGLRMLPWQESFYESAADLIHRAYIGHIDSTINDQYQTVEGSLRFLHNIVRFPGCGVFDTANSWALLDSATRRMQGLLLCSRVRPEVGHITQLCLDPSLRGLGLGRALLQRCLAEFTRRGLRGISLTVTDANPEARKLYEEYGFRTLQTFEAMVWQAG